MTAPDRAAFEAALDDVIALGGWNNEARDRAAGKARAIYDALRAERDAAVEDRRANCLRCGGTGVVIGRSDHFPEDCPECVQSRFTDATQATQKIDLLATTDWLISNDALRAEVATLTAERDANRHKLADTADALALMFQRSPYCPRGFAIPSDCVPDCEWQPVHRWFMGRTSSPLHDENAVLTADNARLRELAVETAAEMLTASGTLPPEDVDQFCIGLRAAIAARETEVK